MLQTLHARYVCLALVQRVLFCMLQAKAKGRGRKRPTQLIIDDADAVQVRGTVRMTILPLHANLSWQMSYATRAVPGAEQYSMINACSAKCFCSLLHRHHCGLLYRLISPNMTN